MHFGACACERINAAVRTQNTYEYEVLEESKCMITGFMHDFVLERRMLGTLSDPPVRLHRAMLMSILCTVALAFCYAQEPPKNPPRGAEAPHISEKCTQEGGLVDSLADSCTDALDAQGSPSCRPHFCAHS